MEAKPSFWWLKQQPKKDNEANLVIPSLDLDISSSLAEFLEKEKDVNSNRISSDVGSILEEIDRVAAQSPLGPYEKSFTLRSVDDIIKEAEIVYMESSKSFEQISQRSKTSQNITDIESKGSSLSPKSLSPLPNDETNDTNSTAESYSEDFISNHNSDEEASEVHHITLSVEDDIPSKEKQSFISDVKTKQRPEETKETPKQDKPSHVIDLKASGDNIKNEKLNADKTKDELITQLQEKDNMLKNLETDNRTLLEDLQNVKVELQQKSILCERNVKKLSSPGYYMEMEKTLEELKDLREMNTALQLQLDTINKTHYLLKNSYDDILNTNQNLERKVAELDNILIKYKNELINIQTQNNKSIENELNLNKLLENEKIQSKNFKIQNENNLKQIQDLNRQIKEMERIITRKHPDSVSALIVAAKNDVADNTSTRRLLEERIRTLEEEATKRDAASSRVFIEIQEKFNQMKLKYESHIEDLELHVNDLKEQLKKKIDTYDVYTQTLRNENISNKDTKTTSSQTHQNTSSSSSSSSNIKGLKRTEKKENKDDVHLSLANKNLHKELTNKDKIIEKLQKELDELQKTNKRLQKERESNLKNFKSQSDQSVCTNNDFDLNDDGIKRLQCEKEKIKKQLLKIEEDYQALKTKRLHDLNTLQEAHEKELTVFLNKLTPLKEQCELQKVTISTLKSQLGKTQEDLALITVERDHLSQMVANSNGLSSNIDEIEKLRKQIAFLEKRYDEREYRIKGILQGLAHKSVTNRSCEQCAERQKQLIGYKIELDQLMASVRALK